MQEAEFTQFVTATKRAVLGAVRANLRPDLRHSLDDVVQEAYIRMYRFIEKNGSPAEHDHVRAWAYVVARNEARRWNGRNRPMEREPEFERPDPRSADPSLRLEDEEELAELLAAIPPPFRAPLELLGRDLSTGEVALALGIPPGTAKSRISRGRALLRRLVDKRRESPEGLFHDAS